ncbi:MAG: DUF6029 family protein [Candidatus Kapaibacterium sp.]
MKKLILLLFISAVAGANAQDLLGGRFSGNFQIDAQYYQPDSTIGAEEVPEKLRSNSFFNLRYRTDNFEAGMRYEAYLNPILGFDPQYEGSGIPYRYLSYNSDFIEITAGDFYEQFGSGMILRAYEERQLGLDNAIDGLRVKIMPTDGVTLTGLIGKQRFFWDKGEGIVRGGDAEVVLTNLFPEFLPFHYTWSVGASVVSKFQPDIEPFYHLPENVLAWTARTAFLGYNFSIDAEYAYKYNDPNATNDYNFNPGNGLILNGAYFVKGFSASLGLHRIDNMDFRSERDVRGNALNLSFIPPLTKQHPFRLQNVFPYNTQLNGEAGIQAEVTYKIPRGSALGGDFGTTINLNYSRVQALDTTHTMVDSARGIALEYDAEFFNPDTRLYFQDINLDISRRFSMDFKSTLSLMHQIYDRDVLENEGAAKFGKVNSFVAALELIFSLSDNHSLKTEIQHMWASQDSSFSADDNLYGNWLMLLAEYTISPNWYITLYDEYNYAEDADAGLDRSIHYPSAAVAYVHNTTRISAGYGRQRAGILCVGGVCRMVPAATGFTLSITSSF